MKIEDLLVKETIIFQEKKRIEFLLASRTAVTDEILNKNNFTAATSFVNKAFQQDAEIKKNLGNLFLHNYQFEKRDSYLPLLLNAQLVASNFGENIEKRK